MLKLGEEVARENGVDITELMMLRHAPDEVRMLAEREVSVLDYSSVQPTDSRYDYLATGKPPIKVLIVLVGDVVEAIFEVRGVLRTGTTLDLGAPGQIELNLKRGKSAKQAKEFDLRPLESSFLRRVASGWAGRERTTVQRSDDSFFDQIEVEGQEEFLYGDQSTLQIVESAAMALGNGATLQAIAARIRRVHPDFNMGNLHADLNTLSVNSPSRIHYFGNRSPRIADPRNPIDKLFKVGVRTGVTYEPYDPAQHGLWGIVANGSALEVRRVGWPDLSEELAKATIEAEVEIEFDASADSDDRLRVARSIVQRQGQPAFRNALMDAYQGRCALTDCDLREVLEAAHIVPYRGARTNHVANGLLLRADVHTLFDMGLLGIDADSMTCWISEKLRNSMYAELEGRPVRVPTKVDQRPSRDALLTRSRAKD